jgi:DNA-binding response OmpR family regulator
MSLDPVTPAFEGDSFVAERPMAMAPSILLLEDDAALRDRILAPGLRDFGFRVTPAGSAGELDRLWPQATYDVVVLDLGLPDEDGFSVARRLRERSAVGIVMLTGRGDTPDRIRGLSGDADAYLTKPVILAELAATLHSLLRRLRPPTANGHWRLDANGWRLLTPDGAGVALNQAERTVLHALIAGDGEPIDRETLIGLLTDDTSQFDPHRLEMLVYRLRAKVADVTGQVLPLRALRGAGYVLTR